jgi:predicted signal transduction protein with EAL and GGDEF domain
MPTWHSMPRRKTAATCSTLFEENMLTDIRNEKALVRELRAAMLLRHLRVAYQPIVDVDGQLIGFEALLRWRHALRGVIPPDVFIPVAERALMIGEIGKLRAAAGLRRPPQAAGCEGQRQSFGQPDRHA